MNHKLNYENVNAVLDVAFVKMPFHVYMVLCDVLEIALKQEGKARVVKSGAKKRRK